MNYAFIQFSKTFPNVVETGLTTHPNFKLLGSLTGWFYTLRPIFWTWIFFRMSRFLYENARNWYNGTGEEHYFWYYDNLYPDFIVDPDDNRYINFQYADEPVMPE